MNFICRRIISVISTFYSDAGVFAFLLQETSTVFSPPIDQRQSMKVHHPGKGAARQNKTSSRVIFREDGAENSRLEIRQSCRTDLLLP
jgi:hypothetical protein